MFFFKIWIQIQEALLAEGDKADVEEELAAYASLLPTGKNLPFVLYFEIENAVVREKLLKQYCGTENALSLVLGNGKRVLGKALDDGVSRVTEEGKTSAVHFLEFPLTLAEANAAKGPIQIVSDHPNYLHAASLSESTWQTLKRELD